MMVVLRNISSGCRHVQARVAGIKCANGGGLSIHSNDEVSVWNIFPFRFFSSQIFSCQKLNHHFSIGL